MFLLWNIYTVYTIGYNCKLIYESLGDPLTQLRDDRVRSFDLWQVTRIEDVDTSEIDNNTIIVYLLILSKNLHLWD